MRILLLTLVALGVLGGGAAWAYFYFINPANASIGMSDEHQKAGEADE